MIEGHRPRTDGWPRRWPRRWPAIPLSLPPGRSSHTGHGKRLDVSVGRTWAARGLLVCRPLGEGPASHLLEPALRHWQGGWGRVLLLREAISPRGSARTPPPQGQPPLRPTVFFLEADAFNLSWECLCKKLGTYSSIKVLAVFFTNGSRRRGRPSSRATELPTAQQFVGRWPN